jgi:serine/threonine protein kinase
LKPGNIFVTNDGVVKLLDFGIAKVLSGMAGALDTQTLATMMTPSTQAQNKSTARRSRRSRTFYSLGVVLYELLTGHRPYRLLSAAMHEIARVIVEVEPTRPSDVVTRTEPASSDATRFHSHLKPSAPPARSQASAEAPPGRSRFDLLMALRKEPSAVMGQWTRLPKICSGTWNNGL